MSPPPPPRISLLYLEVGTILYESFENINIVVQWIRINTEFKHSQVTKNLFFIQQFITNWLNQRVFKFGVWNLFLRAWKISKRHSLILFHFNLFKIYYPHPMYTWDKSNGEWGRVICSPHLVVNAQISKEWFTGCTFCVKFSNAVSLRKRLRVWWITNFELAKRMLYSTQNEGFDTNHF